jgi:hypothetical protein
LEGYIFIQACIYIGSVYPILHIIERVSKNFYPVVFIGEILLRYRLSHPSVRFLYDFSGQGNMNYYRDFDIHGFMNQGVDSHGHFSKYSSKYLNSNIQSECHRKYFVDRI